MPTHPTFRRSTATTLIAIFICCTLLFSTLVMGRSTQSPGGGQAQSRRGTPESGPPVATLPNLDEVRRKHHQRPEAPAHIPSIMRNRRKPIEPRRGRKVGDPGTSTTVIGTINNSTTATITPSVGARVTSSDSRAAMDSNSQNDRTTKTARARLNHAGAGVPPPPSFVDYQYVQNTYQMALARQPNSAEQSYWNDILRAALTHGSSLAHGQTAMVLAAREIGKTLFESAEYAARNRSNHDYVYDLYKTYLLRSPDSGGWAFWEGLVPALGREDVRRAFDESGEFAYDVSTVTSGGSPSTTVSSLMSARVDANNQSGHQIMARDAEWSLPLLELPGRAGLDLGLGLSYSSAAVWTRSGPYIYFDDDNSSLSPGFRLGFPSVQELFFDAQVGQSAYLLSTAAGSRVELRQMGSTNVYESGDSSYLQLTDNSSSLLLRSTDGTQMSYTKIENEWRCTNIKDRNGNYITVNYNSLGDVTTVVDTLGRVVTFNYDSNANLASIVQMWNGQSHTWATFHFDPMTIQPNFSSVSLSGVANGQSVSMLTMIGLGDSSYYKFVYTNWNSGQVARVTHYASDSNPVSDNHERLHIAFDYLAPDDPTRLTAMRMAAENWTGINGLPSEVTTSYGFDGGSACWMITPDNTVYKEFYGSGWQKRLSIRSEVWTGDGSEQKWTTTNWSHDGTSNASFPTNPRATETNVYDAAGNRRRTTVDYYPAFGLPNLVTEYGSDGSTPIRFTVHGYKNDDAYLSRRIIGLPYVDYVFNGSWQLASKTTYEYDWRNGYMTQQAPSVQHDTTNYGANLDFGRGILVAVRRWNVNAQDDVNQAIWTIQRGYNLAGDITFNRDASGHQMNISYSDSFSDGNNNRNTLAYPTMVKDPDWNATSALNNYSTVQYNYDLGVKTRTQGPPPAGQSQGMVRSFSYDNAGRLQQANTENNWTYTRLYYGPNYVQSWSSVNTLADEAYAIEVLNGVGQVIGTASNHPGSTGGYKAQNTYYDQMGRVLKQSNPTEINVSWAPSGDDAAGWLYTLQTYDFKGRPLVTTKPDNRTSSVTYNSCGCAGGDVETHTDEGTMDAGAPKRRQQKVYHDALGRVWKTEISNWQGGGIYLTTSTTYNALDQRTLVRQTDSNGVSQDATMTYDGHGRLLSKHTPEQNVGASTTYSYNADDTTLSVTDARGASATYGYNNRHLLTGITYAAPIGSGIIVPAAVIYAYDAAGNRTSMSDGFGTKSYAYDQLSRMTSETRTFTGVGAFALNYEYNLAGELKKLTDVTNNMVLNYGYDNAGKLSGVTGSGTLYAGVSNYASNFRYRAFGGLKAMTDGTNHVSNVGYNARLQVNHFDVSGGVVNQNYDYYDDGRISFVHNTTDANFDRGYSYDPVGRLRDASTGGLARGGYGDVPYHETFVYDAWSNLTSRTTELWNGAQYFDDAANYSGNRRIGWGYDADGRNTTLDTRTYSYDAAGQQTQMTGQQWISNHYTNVSQTAGYDGDGVKVKSVSSGVITYYLASSALGGAIVEELNSAGQKNVGYVYAPGGQLLAQQASGAVSWIHNTPAGTSKYSTFSSSSYPFRIELDPLGSDVSLTAPITPDTGGGDGDVGAGHFGGLMSGMLSDIFNPSGGCVVDGWSANCSIAAFYVNFGTGNQTNLLSPVSTTMDDLANSLGVVFKPTGDLIVTINVSGLSGTPGHETTEMGWVQDPQTNQWYFVPIPTSYSGTTAISGSVIALSGGIQARTQTPTDPTFGLGPPPPNRLSGTQATFTQNALNRARAYAQTCGQFINDLLQKAAAAVDRQWWATNERPTQTDGQYIGYDVNQALSYYQDRLTRGFVGASNTSNGTVVGTTNPNNSYWVTWNNSFFNLSMDEAGLHSLHEALHQFPGFDDAVLANAARAVDRQGYENYSTHQDPVGDASRELNRHINAHCLPR